MLNNLKTNKYLFCQVKIHHIKLRERFGLPAGLHELFEGTLLPPFPNRFVIVLKLYYFDPLAAGAYPRATSKRFKLNAAPVLLSPLAAVPSERETFEQ